MTRTGANPCVPIAHLQRRSKTVVSGDWTLKTIFGDAKFRHSRAVLRSFGGPFPLASALSLLPSFPSPHFPLALDGSGMAQNSPKFAHPTKQQEVIVPDLTIKELLDAIPSVCIRHRRCRKNLN